MKYGMQDTGDYISRDAAKKQMRNGRHSMEWLLASGAKTIGDSFEIILDEVPTADVRPVVRGKWKRVVDFTGVEAFGFKETMVVGWGCNVCGYEVDVSEESFNYCPNCGADMRGEQDV